MASELHFGAPFNRPKCDVVRHPDGTIDYYAENGAWLGRYAAYPPIAKLNSPKEPTMQITYKNTHKDSIEKTPLKHLIIERVDGRSDLLVVRSSKDVGEPQFRLEMGIEDAKLVIQALNLTVQKLEDLQPKPPARTDIQAR